MSSYDERTEGRGHHQQGLQIPDEITSVAAIDGQPTRNRRPGVSGWLSGKWRAMGGRGGEGRATHRDTNYLSSSLPVLDVQGKSPLSRPGFFCSFSKIQGARNASIFLETLAKTQHLSKLKPCKNSAGLTDRRFSPHEPPKNWAKKPCSRHSPIFTKQWEE